MTVWRISASTEPSAWTLSTATPVCVKRVSGERQPHTHRLVQMAPHHQTLDRLDREQQQTQIHVVN